jgi:WD40 repeat protein
VTDAIGRLSSAGVLALAVTATGVLGQATTLAVLGQPTTPAIERASLEGHRGPVSAVRFSPDGRLLASGGFDGSVRIWDPATRTAVRTLTGHVGEVFGIAFSPDGRWLVSTGHDRSIRVWSIAEGREARASTLATYATAIDVSTSGLVAVGAQDGRIAIEELATGSAQRAWRADFPVNTLAFSPDGTRLVTGGPVTLWDASTGSRIKTPQLPGGVHAIAFSPDGALVASAHWRGVAHVWTIATDTIRALDAPMPMRVPGPAGTEEVQARLPLAAIAFSPDGTSIATAGADKHLRIWNVGTSRVMRDLTGHLMSVVGLSWSPDGRLLASASLDGTIGIWTTR